VCVCVMHNLCPISKTFGGNSALPNEMQSNCLAMLAA